MQYIASLRDAGERCGAVLIVPPAGWAPAFSLPNQQTLRFATQVQALHNLRYLGAPLAAAAAAAPGVPLHPRYAGAPTRVLIKDALERQQRERAGVPGTPGGDSTLDGDGDDAAVPNAYGVRDGCMHSVASLRAYDRAFQERYFRSQGVAAAGMAASAAAPPTVEAVEGEFWRLVEAPAGSEVEVLTAPDVSTLVVGSGFPAAATARGAAKAYATSPWSAANLPRHAASALRYEEAAPGITVPWLKLNMCMSASCWQVEAHNLYGVSYMHQGAAKVWYSVPACAHEQLRALLRAETAAAAGAAVLEEEEGVDLAGEAEGEGMATGDADNGVGAAHSAERAAAEAAVRLLVGDSPLSFLSFPHSDPVVLTCALCFPRPVTVGARCPAWSGSSLG